MLFEETEKRVVQLNYEDKFELSDLYERRLYLNGEVDKTVIESLVYHILRYNREDKGKPIDTRKPILLYINSPGGNISDGYGLIDAILDSNTPIYTINQGLCASMAFLIFIAGIKRYSMRRSEFLMHDGKISGWDSISKMKDRMEFETIQLETMTKKYVLDRTKISSDLYDMKYRVEWYMLPDEAKLYGICTDIVGVDCNIDSIV